MAAQGGTAITLAPTPALLVKSSCTVGANKIGFEIFQDQDNRDMARAQFTTIFGPMMKSFGIFEFLWIQPTHGQWAASVANAGAKPEARPTQSDRDLADKVGAVLGAHVEDLTL